MLYIGKIDGKKLGKYKDKILTEIVILTTERKKHILEHHPGDYENYHMYIKEILKNPDYIIDDAKNKDTVLYLKSLQENKKNIQIVVKLNTNQINNGKYNSIITLWKMKTNTYKQLIRNKEIIYSILDKNE